MNAVGSFDLAEPVQCWLCACIIPVFDIGHVGQPFIGVPTETSASSGQKVHSSAEAWDKLKGVLCGNWLRCKNHTRGVKENRLKKTEENRFAKGGRY